MGHVVPVSDEGDPPAREAAQGLFQRHHVGEGLARMVLVGQGVDDRDAGVGRELLHPGVGKGPDRERRQVAREDPRGVRHGLPVAKLELVGSQDDREHPERPRGVLEADPRPG